MQNRPDQFNAVQPGITYSTVPQSAGIRSQRTEIPPQTMVMQEDDNQSSESFTANSSGEKKVERILVFYTDGSFREFTQTV